MSRNFPISAEAVRSYQRSHINVKLTELIKDYPKLSNGIKAYPLVTASQVLINDVLCNEFSDLSRSCENLSYQSLD